MLMRYEDRSISELAKTYNAFANELGLKLVKKFRTKVEGVERVKKIGDMHTEKFSQFNQPNGAINGADMTNITETIRAAQEEETDLPDDPVEAKAILEQQFSGEGDPEFRSLEGQNSSWAAEEDVTEPKQEQEQEQEAEERVMEGNTANAETHQEFGDPELPAPSSEGKVKKSKGQKVRSVKASSKSDFSAEVDLSTPETIFSAFRYKDDTNKARLTKTLAENLGELISIKNLIPIVYGEAEEDKVNAILIVSTGLTMAIDKHNLPFSVERTKRDGEYYLALHYTPSKE